MWFILLLLILTAGCLGIGKPQVLGYESHWGEITPSYSEVITKIDVKNPNPFPIPLKAIEIKLYMNGVEMGEGRSIGDAGLKPNSVTTITISTKIDNSKIPEWWVKHIKSGEVSELLLKGDVVFDLKITEFRFPFEERDEIRTHILSGFRTEKSVGIGPFGVRIKIDPEWGEVTRDYTQIVLNTQIDSDIEMKLKKLEYEVVMNGIVIGKGSSDENVEIKKGKNDLRLKLYLNNDKLDDWWVTHLKNGEKSEVEIVVTGTFEVAGITYKGELLRERSVFETNILS